MDALIVGRAISLMWSLPSLLSRSGFNVDAITTSSLLRVSKFVRKVDRAGSYDEMVRLAYARICNRAIPYDWVIACDDDTVRDLSRMDWPEGFEPRYLPRTEVGQLSHIYSKIGLSQVLSAGGVKTPLFRVATNCQDAVAAANELGYPVLIKADSGNGGNCVWECKNDRDVRKLEDVFKAEPMLVQRRIEGRELDLSAIYFEQKLVHFAYSVIEWSLPQFAPSVIRTYYPLPLVAEEIFEEVSTLGRVLNANGFVTIGCIEAADGSGRYYFEADMRTNVWIDFSSFYGEDEKSRIRAWFSNGAYLCKENIRGDAGCLPVTIPYFQRIALWELMVNRYHVWKYIPWTDTKMILTLLCAHAVMPVARTMMPSRLRQMVKRRMLAVGVPFP
ncbi:ATP-grasp domain-containing protein [Acidicapsa ligni]|uniref:ATP-grasp domain-containing protein n=1 Tax=Acidicapsa ligni TaxID=542300 RepID=UPI0021DFA9DD|nr:ATP-grasp domain-containing protein [Acidicapsa ligni]